MGNFARLRSGQSQVMEINSRLWREQPQGYQMTYHETAEIALKPQSCKWEDLKAVNERVTVDTG